LNTVNKKILIVEDEMIISLMIERMIRQLGHTVVDRVITGEAAVEAAEKHQPDLILMDIRLKGKLDGIEAMMQIREKANIPVIYITGNTDSMYRKKAEQTEYLDFLTKPITYGELNRSFNFAS